ncbi:hypothetical protein EIP91_002383 [Steccherinum ochraceum]|uniref:Uncharacterized protein n=1 Tax=Steccherinum ochraceum TaxID=92696 RepID=A0A4R0RTY1_9APHY|nr:hypothetical protein EIP91_002383 [Steccherinum ochraceum]
MAGLRRVQLRSTTTPLRNYLPVVQTLLCKMKVLSIEEIILRASFDLFSEFDPDSFRDLNEAIVNSEFSSLRVLRFVYRGSVPLSPEEVRSKIYRALSSLEGRGIIVEFKKEHAV